MRWLYLLLCNNIVASAFWISKPPPLHLSQAYMSSLEAEGGRGREEDAMDIDQITKQAQEKLLSLHAAAMSSGSSDAVPFLLQMREAIAETSQWLMKVVPCEHEKGDLRKSFEIPVVDKTQMV